MMGVPGNLGDYIVGGVVLYAAWRHIISQPRQSYRRIYRDNEVEYKVLSRHKSLVLVRARARARPIDFLRRALFSLFVVNF